jgi:hypothetical protein
MFVKLTVDGEPIYFSTAYKPITYNGEVYDECGHLLQISDMTDDLQGSAGDVKVSFTGIPTDPSMVSLVLSSPTKGAKLDIYRVFLDDNFEVLNNGIFLRYKGYINNYSIQDTTEEYDATTTISLSCMSIDSVLDNKITGRRTNNVDHRKFFPNDPSLSRVSSLAHTSFDFGKPYTAPANPTGNASASKNGVMTA